MFDQQTGTTAPIRQGFGLTEAAEFIASGRWIFAKSMPTVPHEYVVRDHYHGQVALDRFEQYVMFIWSRGFPLSWRGRPAKPYLVLGEHIYWTMTRNLDVTTIINREKFLTSELFQPYVQAYERS